MVMGYGTAFRSRAPDGVRPEWVWTYGVKVSCTVSYSCRETENKVLAKGKGGTEHDGLKIHLTYIATLDPYSYHIIAQLTH